MSLELLTSALSSFSVAIRVSYLLSNYCSSTENQLFSSDILSISPFFQSVKVSRMDFLITFISPVTVTLFSCFLCLFFCMKGLLVIALTAAIKQLHPPHCTSEDQSACVGPTAGQMAFLLFGFALMVVGAGGIRPCNLAFGADQFNPNTESGKRGINSFFNWYFFTLTFAMMVSLTLIVYVQTDVSWVIGLAIPAAFMFISCVLFFVGTKIYVIVKPEGSPLTSLVQVIVAAVKKRWLPLPEQPWLSLFNYTPPKSINLKLPYTQQFR